MLERGRDGGWGLRHAIAEERAKRERRDAVERLRAELTLAGVRIVPRPRDWGSRPSRGLAAFIDTHNHHVMVLLLVAGRLYGVSSTGNFINT